MTNYNYVDLTNKKFSRLLVLNRVENKRDRVAWNCLCDCGSIKIVVGTDLKEGNVQSCGCLKKQLLTKTKTKHGLSNHRLAKTWYNMLHRCLDIKHKHYLHYGGRGIKVCNRWMILENFIEDMYGSYAENLSLDRINNNGNYCKENCRWATKKEQAINRRTTKNK